MNGLFSNPWIQVGLGILGASKPGVPGSQALGQGGLLGLESIRRQREADQMQQYRQAQADAARDKMEQARRERQAQIAFAQAMSGQTPGYPQTTGAPPPQGIVSPGPVDPYTPIRTVVDAEGVANWEFAGDEPLGGGYADALDIQYQARTALAEIEDKERQLSDPNISRLAAEAGYDLTKAKNDLDAQKRYWLKLAQEKEVARAGASSINVSPQIFPNMGKEVRNKYEKLAFDAGEMLSGLTEIQEDWDPSYQEIPTRAGFAWDRVRDKWGVLPGEDKAGLRQFSRHKRRTYEAMNAYLNRMSGAAITEHEARRLTKVLPNAGEGVFDGDSPQEFAEKMEDGIRAQKLALIRYKYARDKGLDFDPGADDAFGISLKKNVLVELVAKDIERTYREQGLSGADIEEAVLDDLDFIFKGI